MTTKSVVISSDYEKWFDLEDSIVAQIEVSESDTASTPAHDLTVIQSFKLKDKQLGWTDEAGGES